VGNDAACTLEDLDNESRQEAASRAASERPSCGGEPEPAAGHPGLYLKARDTRTWRWAYRDALARKAAKTSSDETPPPQ